MSSMATMSSRILHLPAPVPLGDTETSLQATRDPLPQLSLKRRASTSLEDHDEDHSRKRIKESNQTGKQKDEHKEAPDVESTRLAEELAQELQCGCCSELVYRPVLVTPCQHFFCGSCCVLWVQNRGTNCPACRGMATSVTPFRTMQTIVDTLLRSAPHLTRAEGERQQADEVYRAGQSIRIPPPRERTPEPDLNEASEYARPCPHCLPSNPYGWQCPHPVPDPIVNIDDAWHLENGTPPGHAHCGNCENLLATAAPTTKKCGFCKVYFCGLHVQERCTALPLSLQHPQGLNDVSDLIQSSDVYECFEGNTVEAEYMLDYLRAQRLTPKHIYRDIIAHTRSLPQGFTSLIEQDIFLDLYGVAPATDGPDPDGPTHICRLCATEVLIWGLKDWWIRERAKGFIEEAITKRPDCPDRSDCNHQHEFAHAKEFNHIFPGVSADMPQPEPHAAASNLALRETSPEGSEDALVPPMTLADLF